MIFTISEIICEAIGQNTTSGHYIKLQLWTVYFASQRCSMSSLLVTLYTASWCSSFICVSCTKENFPYKQAACLPELFVKWINGR
jgi:hypothetical protein